MSASARCVLRAKLFCSLTPPPWATIEERADAFPLGVLLETSVDSVSRA